jgi:hypothetical protein
MVKEKGKMMRTLLMTMILGLLWSPAVKADGTYGLCDSQVEKALSIQFNQGNIPRQVTVEEYRREVQDTQTDSTTLNDDFYREIGVFRQDSQNPCFIYSQKKPPLGAGEEPIGSSIWLSGATFTQGCNQIVCADQQPDFTHGYTVGFATTAIPNCDAATAPRCPASSIPGCNTHADCNDGSSCTRDVCLSATKTCVNHPLRDGVSCTGPAAESCKVAECVSGQCLNVADSSTPACLPPATCGTAIYPELSPVEDRDGDGDFDQCDNCALAPNADQSDRDGDSLGDACDLCPDNKDIGDDCPRDEAGNCVCIDPNPNPTPEDCTAAGGVVEELPPGFDADDVFTVNDALKNIEAVYYDKDGVPLVQSMDFNNNIIWNGKCVVRAGGVNMIGTGCALQSTASSAAVALLPLGWAMVLLWRSRKR